jgi:NAD(P)-dependent dehydrogenase (short-subunit alcohol dehydrogenase family)
MQIAVITGASSGIGQATARLIADRDMGVVLTYRNRADDAAALVSEIQARGGSAVALPLDLADVSSFPSFVAALSAALEETWQTDRVHALINNGGIGGGAPFDEVTEEMFDRFHATLFKGPYFLTQALLPLLADGSAIVNTGSTSALPTGIEVGYSSYASQKGAIHTLTRCWAKELAGRGIRVNAVAPGSTRTRIADDAFASLSADVLEQVSSTVALGRIGEPEDLARTIAFLAGADSRWITGEVLECSGGQGL